MSLVLTRSPYSIYESVGTDLSGKLTITINASVVYTIVKNNTDPSNLILWEVSELIRDYIDFRYEGGTLALFQQGIIEVTINTYSYTGENGTGTETALNTYTFDASEGYSYHNEGYNFTSTRGVMVTNDTIYRPNDEIVRIPIFPDDVTSYTFLNKGEIVFSGTPISTAGAYFDYVTITDNLFDYYQTNYRERVLQDDGIVEESRCLTEFFDSVDYGEVDQVYFDTTDGIQILDIKTIEECKYTPLKVSFINRWGALQDVWFFKKSVESMEIKKENFKSLDITPIGSWRTQRHVNQDYNIVSNSKMRLNTGYVDESYNEVMRELMQSEKVWLNMDDKIEPINVDTKSLTFKTSLNDKLVEYGIDISFSYNDINEIR